MLGYFVGGSVVFFGIAAVLFGLARKYRVRNVEVPSDRM